MSQDLREIMMDVRDRVIRIETRMESLPELEDKVERQGREILKAKTSVNILRWLAGVFFITVPASVYAVVRVFKG